MARTKFTEEVCQCLIENYSKGVPLKYCADAAGINRKTIYDWMKKGEKAKSGKYHQFYKDMQKAKSKFISHHMQKIGDSKSWMASQYLLQVTDTEQFVVAEKKEIEATTKNEVTTNYIDTLGIYDKSNKDLDDVDDVLDILDTVTEDE